MKKEQGSKHPVPGPCSQLFTVVIGYPRNHQIRVIKLIRELKILNCICPFLLFLLYIFVNSCTDIHNF